MRYVDGFLLVVPKKKLAAYKKLAQKASVVWMDHGALQYCECAGEDLNIKKIQTFPKLMKTKPSETVVFAWIAYKSRKHRDAVNKKVMADERLKSMCDPNNMPFDFKRMHYGGFEIMVDK